jgi:hypothetical protein
VKLEELFLPKLFHNDQKIRKKAVMKEKDKYLLKQVVENDKNPEIRELAKTRLKELLTSDKP